ncbi:MAG: hypothetical protein ABI700_15505 [Chloroflexota bacterium]
MRKLGLIALLMMLCISGAAFAQTSMPVFCGDLSAADCTILTNSQSASKTLDSASFDLNVNTTISNVPDMQEPVVIGVTGNGSYSGLAALHNTDMSTMQTDPGAFLSNLLANFDGDLTLTVNLPPAVVAQAGANMPSSLTLQLRLVDGFGYINFDTLKALMSDMGGMNLSGWGGLDLASLLKAALQQMPDMFNNMSSGMSSGMNMGSAMQQFTDPAFVGKFVTIKRTDAGTGDTATFETTVNLSALMAQPEFQDMMRQQMQAQGQTMQQQNMDQMMTMMTMMYQNLTITVTEEIGLSDSFVHSIHGAINFDTSAMMTAMGSMDSAGSSITPTPGVAKPAPVVNIDFTLTYSDFNSAPAIIAPPNAMILPWQSLIGMDMATAEATDQMMTPTMTATSEIPATVEPTMEVTAEPTSEMTAEPTSEVTSEPTVPVTVEPTVEVTAGS